MNVEEDAIHRGFSAIGEALIRDAEIIAGKWMKKERGEVSSAGNAHRDELKNRMPGYLKTLGIKLVERAASGPAPHLLAHAHGIQRLQSDWKLNEVIADYQILHVTLLEHLTEALQRSLTVEEMKTLGSEIDEAIMAAADAFMEQTKTELEKLKQKHEAQIKDRTRIADQRISELKDTTKDLIKSKDCERKQISDILRDELLQLMAICRLRAEGLRANMDEASCVDELETIIHILRKALSVAKNLTRELSAARSKAKMNILSDCGKPHGSNG